MSVETRINRILAHLDSDSLRRELGLPRFNRKQRVRVHHGWTLPTDFWAGLKHEDRHLARILAVDRSARSRPLFSHLSAAVLLGLPLYSGVKGEVHTIVGLKSTTNRSRGLVRHRVPVRDVEVIEIAGLRCTSPDRTLFDLALSTPAETALAAADGYLREEFRVGRNIDEDRLGWWRQDMAGRLRDARAARGVREARRVIALATPVTDSVLESVSHLQLRRLGFEVALQVAVPAPNRGKYYMDFEFIGLKLFGECDGKNKYTDPELLGAISAEERVYRDKRRQDWVCGSTGYGTVRWGYPDVPTAPTLGRRLLAFGVPVPRW